MILMNHQPRKCPFFGSFDASTTKIRWKKRRLILLMLYFLCSVTTSFNGTIFHTGAPLTTYSAKCFPPYYFQINRLHCCKNTNMLLANGLIITPIGISSSFSQTQPPLSIHICLVYIIQHGNYFVRKKLLFKSPPSCMHHWYFSLTC